jgi:hypothetical protein
MADREIGERAAPRPLSIGATKHGIGMATGLRRPSVARLSFSFHFFSVSHLSSSGRHLPAVTLSAVVTAFVSGLAPHSFFI